MSTATSFYDFSAGIAVTSAPLPSRSGGRYAEQAGELIHMSGTDFYYENMVTLAERLFEIAPMPGPHKIYYGNSGAEAIECALKLARYHTSGKTSLRSSARFMDAPWARCRLTASKPQQRRRFGPLMPGVTHVRYPDVYRGCSGGAQDADAFALAAHASSKRNYLRPLFSRGSGRDLCGAGAGRRRLRGRADYFHARAAAHLRSSRNPSRPRRSAERRGPHRQVVGGGAHGVEPDMICIAKGIASGMPLGITMTRAEIMDWVPGSHASTFGGNPVCVAAALATLDVIEKENLLQHATEVGDHMMKRMANWPEKLKLVGDVRGRGRGLMIGVDIVKDKTTKEYGACRA